MKNHPLIFLLPILILLSQPTFPQDFWEIVPTPDTARNNEIIVHPNGDLFLGTADFGNSNGGVYLSHDYGQTWEFKGISNQTIYSLTIDSIGNIFAGTDSFISLYKSINNGESWYGVLSLQGNVISLLSCSNGLMFAGSGFQSGIMRSIDYGETWDTVLSVLETEQINDLALGPDGKIYAGATAYMVGAGGVYRSSDNGTSWENIGLLYHYIHAICVSANGEVFAGSTGHHYEGYVGVYKYNETTNEWMTLRDDLKVVDIAINSGNTIFLAVSNETGGPGGVYRSMDGGWNWDRINAGLIVNSVNDLTLSQEEYLYAITSTGSDVLHRSINPTVGLANDEIYKNQKIFIFPNPFNSKLYITLKDSKLNPDLFYVYFFDTTGDLVAKKLLQKDGTNSEIELEINNLTSGVYYYRIFSKKYSQSGKLLKIN